MTDILFYKFSIALDYARARRISDERRQEIEHGLYSHHVHPFREILDRIEVRMFLKLPPNINQEEGNIVAKCMDEILKDFRYRVERELERHKQEKEDKKGSKDEHSS